MMMSRSKRRSPARVNSPTLNIPINAAASTGTPPARQCVLVTVLVVMGVGLRVAFPSRIAVEHFDEGVYASNIWFGPESGYQYPMQRFYAPPLLPFLIEWSIILDLLGAPSSSRISSVTPMLPSLVAGCATLLLVWKVTREWFGPDAGLASLAIASLSDFHAVYSRAALTEALLLLCIVASVWAMQRALSRGSYVFLGLAGLLTGLGWWTKYNGWLPLAVGFGGMVVGLVVDAHCRRRFTRLLGFWLGTAAIAFATWSPFLRELQALGGYSEIAANHRNYVVGLNGWVPSLLRQFENLSHFDGWATCAAVGTAVLLVGMMRGTIRQRSIRWFALAIGLCAASALLGAALVMFTLAAWFVGAELYRRWFTRDIGDDSNALPLYFVAAWIGGLFLATPLYHPYPRLMLPWLCGVWIGAGFAISRLVDSATKSNEHPGTSKRWLVGLVIGTLVLLPGLPRVADHGTPAWQRRTGWIPIASQIVAEVGDRAEAARGDRSEAIVIVYGEPGLFFQLNVAGTQYFTPAADLGFVARPSQNVTIPTFLVTGPHAERTAGFRDELARNASRLVRIADYTYLPSDLVLLNQPEPHVSRSLDGSVRREQVILYEVVYERQKE